MEHREHVYLKIGYYYATPADREKYQTAVNACGWPSTYLINQLLSSFVGKNYDYYKAAFSGIAEATGTAPKDLYELCRGVKEPDFPRYINEHPSFGPSPLASVVRVETGEDFKHRMKGFKCSGRNAVGLRIAAHIERESTALTLSRIMAWHFDTYWGRSYQPQIENDLNSTF